MASDYFGSTMKGTARCALNMMNCRDGRCLCKPAGHRNDLPNIHQHTSYVADSAGVGRLSRDVIAFEASCSYEVYVMAESKCMFRAQLCSKWLSVDALKDTTTQRTVLSWVWRCGGIISKTLLSAQHHQQFFHIFVGVSYTVVSFPERTISCSSPC